MSSTSDGFVGKRGDSVPRWAELLFPELAGHFESGLNAFGLA
jgi:hypothetical protein